MSYEDKHFKFLNLWGTSFADNGFFRVKDENVLDNFKMYDVYWILEDLTNNEKIIY